MARSVVLGLLCVILLTSAECRRGGGGRSHSGGRSSSSSGHSYGGGHSSYGGGHSSYGSGSHSSYGSGSYSSGSGSSSFGSGSSWGSYSKPSSSVSGSGYSSSWGSNSKPSYSTSNTGSHSYPGSSSGLSGSSKPSYSFGTGSSLSGGSYGYPGSSGLSGNSKPSQYVPSPSYIKPVSSVPSGTAYQPSSGSSLSGSSYGYPPKNPVGPPQPPKPSYPSSSSGLSGSSKPSSSLYPTSSSGLSGSGSGSVSKPVHVTPLNTASSGSKPSSVSYPSSTGLSGSGQKPSYPTATGMSGNTKPVFNPPLNTGVSYPKSPGLSGSGQKPINNNYVPPSNVGYIPPSTGYNNHGYPASNTGLSGSSFPKYTHTPPPPRYPTNNHGNYISNSQSHYTHPHSYVPNYYTPHYVPNYHATPQYVYIQDYRNSNSRYNDILTGLALYNLGRSHDHHTHHYYHDDYYRTRYETQPGYSNSRPVDEAQCTLKVRENNQEQVLRVPCEIVSTFTEGAQKKPVTTVNQMVCTNVTTVTTNNVTTITNTTTMQNVTNPSTYASNFTTTVTKSATNHTNTASGAFNSTNKSDLGKQMEEAMLAGIPKDFYSDFHSKPLNTSQSNVTMVMNATGHLVPIIINTTTTTPTLAGIPKNFHEDNHYNPFNTTTSKPNITMVMNATGHLVPVVQIASTTARSSDHTNLAKQIYDETLAGLPKNFHEDYHYNPFSITTAKPNITINNAMVMNATGHLVPINQTITNNINVPNNVTITNTSTVYTTVCTNTYTENAIDPLQVKGPKLNPSNAECVVEIRTRDSLMHQTVDCNLLMSYSKVPEPKKKESMLLPSREKLKTWVEKPPWWMSMFIAA